MALDRIRHAGLRSKVISPTEAAGLIQDGMNVGISGFALAGNPKEVLPAMVHEMVAAGETKKINLWTGASTSYEADGILGAHNVVMRRFPYQSSKEMRQCVNRGEVQYTDMHLSLSPQSVRYGWWGHLDVVIIEAAAVTEAGEIVLTTAVGNTPTFAEAADIIILEVNSSFPEALEGIHDLYTPQDPPWREPIPISKPRERIGRQTLQVPLEKIQAIVLSETKEKGPSFVPAEAAHERMAGHLIEFFEREIKAGRMPQALLPLQSGVGNVANAVLAGLAHSRFENLQVYSEVLQDSILTLLESGKLSVASGCALNLSDRAMAKLYADLDWFKERIILRPLEITNHPEIIRRLGIISMNTALEADIYGNVNSTHVMGTRMMNGIGGSGDFTRNAFVSVFFTESTAKNGAISSIVPYVSHTDHTEHDVCVIITEQGAADLRGLSPRERALRIIDKCAHPDFKAPLHDYFQRACQQVGGQTPHLLEEAFAWHNRFIQTGTMKQD